MSASASSTSIKDHLRHYLVSICPLCALCKYLTTAASASAVETATTLYKTSVISPARSSGSELEIGHDPEGLDMTSELSLLGAECQGTLSSFSAITKHILRHLDQQINVPPPACPGLENHEILGPERLTDVRTRFLLWSGNLGVMRTPEDPRALDKRLLDAPEVANRVREILEDLQDLVSQCKSSSTSVPHATYADSRLPARRKTLRLSCNK